MSLATFLAFGAGAAGVLAAWEGLAAIEATALAARLERALAPLVRAGREGRSPSRAERRRLALLATGALMAAGWLLGGPRLALAAGLGGPLLALAAVGARRRRYREALRRGAASVARSLADALSAGHSIRGALARSAEAADGAAGHALRSAARALALGCPTDDVLEDLRVQASSRAWDTLVAAVLLQRDAGGDLAALLRDLAGALEAADRLERDARTATAQARLTAWIVVAMPVAAALLAELSSPGFAAGLLADPLSAWLAGAAAILQVAAVLAVRRLARPRELT